jgi:hypothetical protein
MPKAEGAKYQWDEMPKHFTLANPAHCAWLALQLTKKRAQGYPIEIADRKSVNGALDACTFYAYPPPRELTDLISSMLISKPSRSGVQDRKTFEAAAAISGRDNLTGRALGRAVRAAGFAVADRTIASWEKPFGTKGTASYENRWLNEKGLAERMLIASDWAYLVGKARGDYSEE